ncbi:MAG: hypothetical protein QNK37_32040 [Acidobacteriota bacterium]|nr:hypothetical protein [Acidobacteriota bacterium]
MRACSALLFSIIILPGMSGGPEVNSQSRFKGNFGLNVPISGLPCMLIDENPESLTGYGARFYIRTSDLNLQDGDALVVFSGRDSGGTTWFSLQVGQSSGVPHIQLNARLDNGQTASLAQGALTALNLNGWLGVEMEWIADASAGFLKLFIDGVEVTGLSNLANGAGRIDSVRLGAVAAVNTPAGSVLIDDFASRKVTRIGTLCITQTEFNNMKPVWPSINVIRLMEYFPHFCPPI